MNRIEIKQLSYQYQDGTKALDDVTLAIKQGEKVALIGANGSGKSTLFLCLTGVLKPKVGEVLYDGTKVRFDRKGLKELRSKIGIVFQEPDNQLFSASVYEDISFGLFNMGLEKEEVRRRVEQVVTELQLASFSHKPTHFLSGGQKKQVTIADVLVMDPEVILFDEPAAALDPKNTKLVYERLEALHEKGITLIVSTHDMNHAYEWADKVILFHQGKALKVGTPKEVFTDAALLQLAGVRQPFVLEVFEQIKKQEIKDQWFPSNQDELVQYINKQ